MDNIENNEEKKEIRYKYTKINYRVTKTDSEGKELKVLQNKNYPIFSYVPKLKDDEYQDTISDDFLDSFDYLRKMSKKNPDKLEVYNKLMNRLMGCILNIRSVDDIIDINNEKSFAFRVCEAYRRIYVENTAENYIKKIMEFRETASTDDLVQSYTKIIKQVVRRYVSDTIDTFDKDKKSEINKLRDINEALKCVEFRGNDFSHIRDKVTREFLYTLIKYMTRDLSAEPTICPDCPVLLSCPRLDGHTIDELPFVIDGEQETVLKEHYYVIDEDGYNKRVGEKEAKFFAKEKVTSTQVEEIEAFRVVKCERYNRAMGISKKRTNM